LGGTNPTNQATFSIPYDITDAGRLTYALWLCTREIVETSGQRIPTGNLVGTFAVPRRSPGTAG